MADIVSVAAKYDAFTAEVQGIGVAPPPPPPPVLAIGARCKVTKSPTAGIRATADPNAPGIGSPQPLGAQGTVVAPGASNGFWKVDFDTGTDGWIWAANIVAI
jgi:hypothetical protein